MSNFLFGSERELTPVDDEFNFQTKASLLPILPGRLNMLEDGSKSIVLSYKPVDITLPRLSILTQKTLS